jgi:hypothetical protein
MSKLRVHVGDDGHRVYLGKVKVPCVEKVEIERDGTIIVFFPSLLSHPKKGEIERGINLVKQSGRALIGHIMTEAPAAMQPAAE